MELLFACVREKYFRQIVCYRQIRSSRGRINGCLNGIYTHWVKLYCVMQWFLTFLKWNTWLYEKFAERKINDPKHKRKHPA